MNTEINPWKVLSEKAIYENPWISLVEYRVINPNGGEGIYGKLHMKHVSVGIVAIDETFNIYLVGQYRFALNKYSWEIPEGGSNAGENALDAAKRELAEETGLVAAEWRQLLTMHLSNSISDEFAVVFLARLLSQQRSRPEETEKLVVKKIPFDQAYDMMEKGVITDSMSVSSFLKIRLMQREGRLQ